MPNLTHFVFGPNPDPSPSPSPNPKNTCRILTVTLTRSSIVAVLPSPAVTGGLLPFNRFGPSQTRPFESLYSRDILVIHNKWRFGRLLLEFDGTVSELQAEIRAVQHCATKVPTI